MIGRASAMRGGATADGCRGTGRARLAVRPPMAICLTLALCLLPTAAAPFFEPDGFRGLTWGMSPAQGEQMLKALYAKRVLVGDEPSCEPSGAAERVVCMAQTDIGTVRTKVYFEFVQDRFIAVTLLTTPVWYADLRRGFVERYGPPTRAETKTRVGPFSEYSSEEVVWEGPTVRIKLAQYVGGRTLTVAVIGLRSETDSQAADPQPPGTPPLEK